MTYIQPGCFSISHDFVVGISQFHGSQVRSLQADGEVRRQGELCQGTPMRWGKPTGNRCGKPAGRQGGIGVV
jgi:hypothetical protein